MVADLLDPSRVMRARAVATEVATRAVDPERIAAGVAALGATTAFPEVLRWRAESIALGDAGAAVLCAALDGLDPAAGWDHHGHRLLASAVSAVTEDDDPPASLFVGVSGVAAAARLLSRQGRRYVRLVSALERRLLHIWATAAREVGSADGVDEHDYDLVAGLAGGAAALLLGQGPPGVALTAIGRTLVALGSGYPTAGIAHGASGPLAALALLHRRNPTAVPRSAAAVRALARRVRAGDASGPGWCSGPAGAARALWLAGAAADDPALAAAALDMQLAAEVEHRTPTLCHGTAGVLAAVLCAWWDSRDHRLRRPAAALCDRLLDAYEPDAVFGVRDVEPTGVAVDNPGVLVGAAGVAMALAAAAAPGPQPWARIFLMA